MAKTERKTSLVPNFIKILLVMYITTFVLLLLLAFVLFKTEASELLTKIWLVAVYIISGFLGGFIMGKRVENRKFIWGFLVGFLYFVILFAVSLALHKGLGQDGMHLVTTLILCTASGTVGGMVS